MSKPLRIIEFSSGIAGAYCGWLLQQLGANVTRGRHANIASVTPQTQPQSDVAQSDGITLALVYFNSGKHEQSVPNCPMPSEALERLLESVDILITDDEALLERIAGCPVEELNRRFPEMVLAVASIFGRTGPLARTAATALDAQAVSGVAWVLGDAGRAPLSLPPGLLECQAGVHLASACLMAVHGNRGQVCCGIVDVALADILASYIGVNCRFYIHHGLHYERAGRRASGSGGAYPFVILPCRDGAVCLSGRTRQEWERFVEAMGSPAWAQEPRYRNLRAMGQQYAEEVDALVAPWLRNYTKAEIEELASRHQLTISPLRTFDEVIATPQLQTRGFFEPAQIAGKTMLGPSLPFKVTAKRKAKGEDDLAAQMLAHTQGGQAPTRAIPADPGRGKPLSGLRVLDFGWVWSAPQVGSFLAQLGADVVKVEHGQRLDNARLSGTIVEGGKRVEGDATAISPMFHQINLGKRGITLNLKEPAAVEIAKRLVAKSDIVIENMSPGAMERTGLGFEALRLVNPRLVMLAMTGAGQFGPRADMRTYAPVMSSFVGMENLVGYRNAEPVGALNFGLGDPNAAAHALLALFAALIRRDTAPKDGGGTGCYIDLSQTEALLATLSPYLLQSQHERRQPSLSGNGHPTMAPHGIYPADGADRWLSLAIENDAQWSGLCAFIQETGTEETWSGDDRFLTAAGRIAHRDALDQAIAAWTAVQGRDALVALLRAAGIPSSPVQSIADVWTDAQYTARGMIGRVELPVLGAREMIRAPWSFSQTSPVITSRGPLLGEHNAQVLSEMLGLSAPEIAELQAAGVVA